tara:strand:+ start:3018 stop:4133 length:1116 start_codon:yes stop_codon:yes gene_type:complete
MNNAIAHLTPKISLAEVTNRIDPTKVGLFQARISAESNAERPVMYVTPYASNEAGAFVAVPELGVQVLVCQPAGSADWYYLGSTFAPQPKESTGSLTIDNANLNPLEIAAPDLSRAMGVPMRMQWTGTNGGGFHIMEEMNESMINEKVEIQSSTSKKVSLNDNPTSDSIILNSGNGSTIKVTDNPQNMMDPARAVLIETEGPQKYINSKAQTDIVVLDGMELQVLNNSTGSMGSEEDPAGNVNIQSKWKDVNVFTKAAEGRIFIECLNGDGSNQVIEIQTNGADGAIRIKTNGKVDISANNIGIEASGSINMKGASINMESTQGDFNIRSSSTVNVAGSQVQLNPTYEVPQATPDIGSSEDYYGGSGITTY